MKKISVIVLILIFSAATAFAQQMASGGKSSGKQADVFDGNIGPTYNWIDATGNNHTWEYEYDKSSVGADLHIEYDPLPHRFSIETHYVNQKDYYGDLDYAYHDIVLINALSRGIFHNIEHRSLGQDDPTTLTPSFTDLNPTALYAIANQLNRASIRLKMPDYPAHLYANTLVIDRTGTIQQRFIRAFTGGLDKVSLSRDIDWKSQEVTMGLNSHLGPIEVDFSHTGKKFNPHGETVLFDAYTAPAMNIPHNQVSQLQSSTDTLKLHTSFTGRVVAGLTYASGNRKNDDSGAKNDFKNTAGDLTLTPVAGLTFVMKYRHYDIDATAPATVSAITTPGITTSYSVRDALSQKKDVASGAVRWRINDRLTVRGEYAVESIQHQGGDGSPIAYSSPTDTAANSWAVSAKTTKVSESLGLNYRVLSKLNLRADFKATQIANPAYADDPDSINSLKATATWTPTQKLIILASAADIEEKRNDLSAPLGGGSRKTTRDQALGSVTYIVGKGTSVSASYAIYQNKNKQTLTYWIDTGSGIMYFLDDAVSLATNAQVASLAVTQAMGDNVQLSVEASRTFSKDEFKNSPSIQGAKNDVLTDLNIVEDVLTAGLEIKFSKTLGSEVRYQYRRYDDRIDNAEDGRMQMMLATLFAKW